MSRPRAFDEEAVLERALELFWRDGYAATSLQALLAHMGISRQSLYNTFGDKRRLFLAALDRYADMRAREMLGDLEHESASLAQIFGFFERLGQSAGQKQCEAGNPEGCLIGKSCMELGAADPEVSARIHYFFDRTVGAFRHALDNAVDKGEIEPLDTAATARHLTATLNGLGILHRAGVAVEELGDVVRVALSVLRPKTPPAKA
ncbi:MAG: TetR/AcrR family transcriptional regulator [Sandaracinus sp.]|nr:TetR/AcrR family transcriptional regulator [Sandaracinus sp.]MCB9619654.1 TetR/AcrR family transcriptional regulator [Sandaracinus sp.]MCB9636403.1 TetR/AcrR family transcriptional regulator [Sandaracinus sp.]